MADTLQDPALPARLCAPPSRWRSLTVVSQTGSTNAELAASGQPGDVLVAEHQRTGRGRLGRTWDSPPGTSLSISAMVPAPPKADLAGWLPLLTGLAVQRALHGACEVDTELKWPNDVLAGAGEKVCGILCEVVAEGVVVGMGINVSQTPDQLPVPQATSLALVGATRLDRGEIVAAVLARLDEVLTDLIGYGDPPGPGSVPGPGAPERAMAAYRSSCSTLGRRIVLHGHDGVQQRAEAVGVDDQGRLVVSVDGRTRTVAAADVAHVRRHD